MTVQHHANMNDHRPSESLQQGMDYTCDHPLHGGGLLHSFGHSTFWLWIDRGALRIGNAVAGLLLIRYLGPVNFGTYVTALAYGELVAATLNFGLNLHAARDIGVNPDHGKRIVGASFLISGSSFAVQLMILVIAVWLRNWDFAAIAAGLLLANCEYMASFCRNVLISDLRAKAILPGSILSGIGMLVAAACVILAGLSSLGLLIALTLRSLPVVFLRIYQIRAHWPQRHDLSRVRATLQNSWKYYSYSLVAVAYQRAPIALLGLVALRSDVGLFSAALTIAYLYPLWSDAWNEAVLPLLTRLFEFQHHEELIRMRDQVVELLLFVSVPVAICVSVFAVEICTILGGRFAGSAFVLRILAYRCVVTILDGFLGQAFLTAIGRIRERKNAQVRALFVLAILTLLLGSSWGAVGAAVALFVADFVLFLQYFPVCRLAGLNLNWPTLWPSAGAGAAMTLAALYAPVTLWAYKLAPCLLVYGLVLLVLARPQVLRAGRTLRECIGGSSPELPVG